MFQKSNAGVPDSCSQDNQIRCDVKNCAYHMENDCCHANAIHVQSCTSNNCCVSQDETSCSTFRPKL